MGLSLQKKSNKTCEEFTPCNQIRDYLVVIFDLSAINWCQD